MSESDGSIEFHTASCIEFGKAIYDHFGTASGVCFCECHRENQLFQVAKRIQEPELKPESILEEAIRLTSKDRQSVYGHPKDHFAKTIGLLNELLKDYLKKPLSPEHWPKIMICDKLARSMNTYKRDNMADVAGYAQTHEMVMEDE